MTRSALGRVLRHPLSGLVAVLALFFYPELLLGRIFSPADYLFRFQPWASVRPPGWSRPANELRTDAVLIAYPRLLSTGRDLAREGISWWQGHTLIGTENTLSLHYLGALLWPPDLAFALLPGGAAENLFHLTIPLGAGLAMHCLAVRLTESGWLRLTADLAWALSGYLVVWLSAPTLPLTLIALPLLVRLAAELLGTEGGGWWSGPAFAALLGWTFFMAYPPANIVLALGLAVMAAAAQVAAPGRRWGGVPALAGFTLLGLGVGALALVTDLRDFSSQAGGQYRYVMGPLPRSTLALWLQPNLFGSPVTGDWRPPFDRADLNLAEVTGYAGGALACAAAAGVAALLRRRSWWAVGAAVLVVLSLLLGYTEAGQLPVLREVRPERWLILADLGLILLAVHGANAALESRRWALLLAAALGGGAVLGAVIAGWRQASSHLAAEPDAWLRVGVLAAAAILAVALAGARRQRLLGLALAVATAGELVSFGLFFNPAIPASEFYPETGALRFLSAHSAGYRTLVATPDHMLWGGDVLNVYGIDTVTGYDHLRHADLLDLLGPSVDTWEREEWSVWGFLHLGPSVDYRAPALKLLGVRYAYLPYGVEGLASPAPAGWREVYSGSDGLVYENPAALPAVFALEGGSAVPLRHHPLRPDFDRLSVTGPELVVWSHAGTPGWTAALDGAAVPTTAYDGYFLAVQVPAGRHSLQVAYRPPGVLAGSLVSALAALAVLGVAVVQARAAKRTGRPPTASSR